MGDRFVLRLERGRDEEGHADALRDDVHEGAARASPNHMPHVMAEGEVAYARAARLLQWCAGCEGGARVACGHVRPVVRGPLFPSLNTPLLYRNAARED